MSTTHYNNESNLIAIDDKKEEKIAAAKNKVRSIVYLKAIINHNKTYFLAIKKTKAKTIQEGLVKTEQ